MDGMNTARPAIMALSMETIKDNTGHTCRNAVFAHLPQASLDLRVVHDLDA